MAARYIERHVDRQILAQGGHSAIVERMREGETLAEIARTLFRPDGAAISKRTVDRLMGQAGMRQAMREAKRDFRAIPEWPRRKRRKHIKATEAERIARAQLAHTGVIHGGPMVETDSQRTHLAQMRSLATERRNPYAKLPAPRPAPPRPAPPPEPEPAPPPRRTGVDWDELGQRHWCHDCERRDCIHVKHEYMRRAEAYAAQLRANAPRILRGLV